MPDQIWLALISANEGCTVVTSLNLLKTGNSWQFLLSLERTIVLKLSWLFNVYILFSTFLNYRIFALQYYISFCHKPTWISHRSYLCAFPLEPLWEESKLAKMAYSGSLAPCFVNDDYGTTKIVCRPHMCITRSSLGHRLLCEAHLAPPIKRQELMLRHGCDWWVRQERRENPWISMKIPEVAWILLQLLRQPGEKTVMAAASARREVMCGYVVLCLLLRLLCQLEENKRVCSY